ncbi:aspartate-semialdehyde dehydrogenase, partial [Rhizobium ruizarguesonis]
YVWQDYDLAPDFPEMRGFLKFWEEKLDGPLHSVRYIHRRLISATEWRALKGELILH